MKLSEINKIETNRIRILEEFKHLVSFDSESFHEEKIAEYLKEKLKGLGLKVYEDEAGKILKEKNPSRKHTASNLYAYLKGNKEGDPILFSAHMDTVKPGVGKKVVLHQDGTITSDGNTVLGADDVSGLVSILEALTLIKEKQIGHPDIEVLITVAEEPYCEGSKYIEYDRLKAKHGYVLDLTGPIGRIALAAPSILSTEIRIKGKAAHAGFAPEQGVNALNIAANALSKIQTGHTNDNTTVNFGTILGGQGRNIVPEEIYIEGEIRSLEPRNAREEVVKIEETFRKEASKLGGEVEISITEHIKAYSIKESEYVVRRFAKAILEDDRCRMPECIVTYGGSDANRLNENGISTVVMACGMENCHSKEEYTSIERLEQSAKLTLCLMTMEEI